MQRGVRWLSGVELARRVREGEVTSAALLEVLIAEVEQHNPEINAVVVRNFDAARKRAAEADAALKRGEVWGPLHGVPMTVKENNDLEGLPTTIGNPKNSGRVALANSEAVDRLVRAGAVIFAKTNLPIDVNDVQSYNAIYGTTNNPYNTALTPGGSSGGSAAALACGMTPLELGGDIGGSIRLPAHCCGVFGLKPTYGLIPMTPTPEYRQGDTVIRTDHFVPWDLVVKGPMARTPEDLALLLKVLAGPAAPESRGYTLNLPEAPRELKDLKVVVWGDDELCPVDANIHEAVRRTVDALRSAGATVDEVARPDFCPKEHYDVYRQLLAAALHIPYTPEEIVKEKGKGKEESGWVGQSHHQWWQANAARARMRRRWEEFFDKYDVVVAPIACSAAWPHDQSGETDQPFWKTGERVIRGEGGHDTPYHRQVYWAALATLCYLPAVSFPAGMTSTGLPVGLQAIGREYSDLLLIDFAQKLAAHHEHFRFVPPPRTLE